MLVAGIHRDALNALAKRLGNIGYLVVLAESASQALHLASGGGFDLLLIDALAPETASLHLLKEVRSARELADLPTLFIAAEEEGVAEALAHGADDGVARGSGFPLMAARIDRAIDRSARLEELKRSNMALDARIAAKAIEIGETKFELATLIAERARLSQSLRTLSAA